MSISPSITRSIGQSISNSIGSGRRAIFSSRLQNTLVPQIANGSFTPTFTRATTATVFDYLGLARQVLSGESRFKGARRVANLITASEDLGNAAWLKQAGGSGSVPVQVSGNTFTFQTGGTGSGDFSQFRQNYSTKMLDDTFVANYLISASVPVTMEIFTEGSTTENISVTTTPQVLSTASTSNGTGDAFLIFRLRGDAAGNVSVDITITKIQAENTTGNTDTTLPSEYVSTGVLSSPYHGANVDSVEYFKTLNGNTVTSNVVTEGVGAAIGASNFFADASGPFGIMSETIDILSYLSASNITANNGTISLDWTPAAELQGTIFIWATYVDANNYTAILHDGTNLIFRKRIGGVNSDATKLLTYVTNTTYSLAATYSDSNDSEIYIDGDQGTGNSDNTDIQIGTDFQIGSDGNSLQQPDSSQRLVKIFDVEKTAAEVATIN